MRNLTHLKIKKHDKSTLVAVNAHSVMCQVPIFSGSSFSSLSAF